MLVLVDGSNVRRSTWPNPSPDVLVAALDEWANREHPGAAVIVVFDGTSNAESTKTVEVVDVGYADDELVAIAMDAVATGRSVLAATSDRELVRRIEDAGCRVAWGGGRLLRELGLARTRRRHGR